MQPSAASSSRTPASRTTHDVVHPDTPAAADDGEAIADDDSGMSQDSQEGMDVDMMGAVGAEPAAVKYLHFPDGVLDGALKFDAIVQQNNCAVHMLNVRKDLARDSHAQRTLPYQARSMCEGHLRAKPALLFFAAWRNGKWAPH